MSKLSADGTSLIFSTFINGTADMDLYGMAVDKSSGKVYVVGTAYSGNSIPTTAGAYQTTFGGGNSDAFVAEVSSDGSQLLYSSYLGGSGDEQGYGIALASSNGSGSGGGGGPKLYVTGSTTATTANTAFPVTSGTYQAQGRGGTATAFVSKLNPAGSGATDLLYSTLLGGSVEDGGEAIAVDSSGSAYITGYTFSPDFTTTSGVYQSSFGGNQYAPNLFVTKLAPDGKSASFSTYIGGGGGTHGYGIALDNNGNILVLGDTTSNYGNGNPTPTTSDAYQRNIAGGWDAYLTKLDPQGQHLLYASLLGGSQDEMNVGLPQGIAIDGSGSVYITGQTFSADFPTTGGAYQTTFATSGYSRDAFIAKFSFNISSPPPPPVSGTLTFTTQPGGGGGAEAAVVQAGSAFPVQPVVTLQNPDGSTVISYTGPISLSIASGSGSGGAILNGPTSITASNGVATFSGISIDRAGSGYILVAAADSQQSGIISANSIPFTVTSVSATPAQIVATGGTAQSTPISTTFATLLQATVSGVGGSPLNGIGVTFQSPTGGAGGVFTGSGSSVIVTTTTNGIATAPAFVANTVTGSYTVTATVSGVITPATFVLTNTSSVAGTVNSWTALGPLHTQTITNAVGVGNYGNVSGRVTSLAFNQTANILYAGTAGGGLYKSPDGGNNWAALTDSQSSLAVGAVTLDPNNNQIIYVATGEANYNSDAGYSSGVLKSSDGGNTWTLLGNSIFGRNRKLHGTHLSKILVDQNNSQHILVAADNGLWFSNDGGNTWSRTLGNSTPNSSNAAAISDIIVDTNTNPSTIWAAWGYPAGDNNNGLYKSTDGGNTFGLVTALPYGAKLGRIAIAQAPSNHSQLFMTTADPVVGSSLGLWASSNNGANWVQITPAVTVGGSDLFGDDLYHNEEEGWYAMVLAVDPAISTTLYVGGVNLYKSVDGGFTFTDLTKVYNSSSITTTNSHISPHPYQHALAFYNGGNSAHPFYLANDGGVYSSADAGNTWSSLNTNLAITQFNAGSTTSNFSINPIIWGSTQSNGIQEYFSSGGSISSTNWTELYGGGSGFVTSDPTNFNKVYATTSNLNVVKTLNGGVSWQTATQGIDSSERSLSTAPLTIDPTNSNHLLIGGVGVYATTDGAATWNKISPSLPADSSKYFGVISALTMAPNFTQTIYVGTGDGKIWVTTNGGTNWTDVTAGTAGVNGRYVSSLAVNPANSQDVVVSFAGFATDDATGSGTHIYRSINGGINWTDISIASSNLPDIPVNSVLRNPTAPNTFYIGTDSGVYYTTNNGTTWLRSSSGLPNAVIENLFSDSSFTNFIAASHGRGVFTLPTSQITGT